MAHIVHYLYGYKNMKISLFMVLGKELQQVD